MNEQPEIQSIEVVQPSSLEALERGTIDIQIATAHRFPRSMTQFKQRALGMATLDEETAHSCIYSRPVGKKDGKQQFAEGLSVRMAEIVGASYGNLRVGSMIIEMTERRVVARGFAHDLETNFASTSEVIEPTVKRDGSPYDERMRAVIAKAALAKARRDATFQVVPKALCKPVEDAVRKLIVGDGSLATIAKRRGNVMIWLKSLGIDMARVFAAIDIKGEDDIGIEQLERLLGIRTAMKDGEVTVDEAFPKVISGGKIGSASENPLEPNNSVGTEKQGSAAEASGGAESAPATGAPASTRPAKPVVTAPPTEPASASPQRTEGDLRSDLEAKCKSAGIDPTELALYLASNKFIPKGTTFAGLSAANIEAVLKDWESVRDGVTGA